MEEIKKELNEIAWNVTEEEYREDKAFSYSTLSRFEREGFEGLEHLYDKVESPSLLFGSVVDTLLTDGKEAFEAKYFVADFPKLTESKLAIIKDLYNKHPEIKDIKDIPSKDVIATADVLKFQTNWGNPKRVEAIIDSSDIYYKMLILSNGRIVVNSEDYNDAIRCIEALKTSESTKRFFQKNNPFDNIRRYYQLKFKGDYNNIEVRCMADLIVVDYEHKTITPVDLKTSSKPEYRFYKSFLDWNYVIQAQLYWYIIKQNLDKDPYFKDFKLNNYKFIVVSRFTVTPLVWDFPDTYNSMAVCHYGKNKQIMLPDWRLLLVELNYYRLNPQCKVPSSIDLNGINNISIFLNSL